jgi:hypothetical protein
MGCRCKGTHSERQQAGHAHECAFREEEKGAAGASFFRDQFGIFQAPLLIETFDKKGANTFQQDIDNCIGLKLSFGYKT